MLQQCPTLNNDIIHCIPYYYDDVAKWWWEVRVSKVLKQSPGKVLVSVQDMITTMRCQQRLSVSIPTGDGAAWGGRQRGMEGRKDGLKGARKVRRSNWEDGWRQSNEETAQPHTCTHKHSYTSTHSHTDKETHTSQTTALGYVSKCTHINTLANRHVRNWHTKKLRENMKSGRYSSKEMGGWQKGMR